MSVRQWFFSGVATALQLPIFVYAAGFVPCGGSGEPACQTCHVVQMVSSVTDWLVGILAAVSAIMFIVAGFKMVTSGGNPSALKDAKDMIVNVAIGFMIILSAWIVIDLSMRSLLKNEQVGSGPWSSISCVNQPIATTINGHLNITTKYDLETSEVCGSLQDCADRAAACQAREGGVANIVNTGGSMRVECQSTTYGTANLPPDLSATGACDSDVVAKYFPDQVGAAQCIIKDESACGGSMVSKTDVMKNDGGRAFSFGPMQINLTVHELEGCGAGGSDLDCKSAFSGRNYGAVVTNENLYQECATAAQNIDCNMSNGRRLQQRRGGWGDWSTASGCGLQ